MEMDDTKRKSHPSSGERRKKGKKAQKRERKAAREVEEEEQLTAAIFGGGVFQDLLIEKKDTRLISKDHRDETEGLFQIDRVGETAPSYPNGLEETIDSKDSGDTVKPAWNDDDDDIAVDLLESTRLRKLRKSRSETGKLDGSEFENRLRRRFQTTTQVSARTDWANVDDRDGSDDEKNALKHQEGLDVLDSAEPLLAGASSRLAPNILDMMRCPDANQADPNQAVVQAIHFHPGSDPDRPLLLTAGFDKTLRFFQVGAEKSEKIHGIHFPKLPIYSASFLGSTGNVVVSGRRPFFYLYDAVAGKLDHVPRIVGREEKSLERCFASPDGRTLAFCGNDGYIILFDAHSKHWIADLKMNGSVRAVTFSANGSQILASGSDGHVYRWDLQSRRCIERFSNEDGTITSYLAASSRHLSVGAESGVVNLYGERQRVFSNAKSPLESQRKPIRSIMNLHTSADMLRFNHDGQILAFSSRREKNSMKLLHVPTSTVFSNWPTSKTPLNYVWSMDFSPQSRYLAIGNDQGKCLLYRLNHYHSA